MSTLFLSCVQRFHPIGEATASLINNFCAFSAAAEFVKYHLIEISDPVQVRMHSNTPADTKYEFESETSKKIVAR